MRAPLPTLLLMPVYQAIILAIVQGLTEFLPISSSAHLALAPWLLGWKDQGLPFDIGLHVGTLAAVVIYFFRDWLQVIAQGFGIPYSPDPHLRQNPRLLWLLALASLPIGVFGLLFKHLAETQWRSPFVIGGMLIGIAALMWIADRTGKMRKNVGELGVVDAVTIGFAQALAIVPGTSRSGITIAAGLLRGMDRPASARFSFLLSTPAVAAAGAKAAYDLYKAGGIPAGMHLPLIVGIVASAITGCLVIGLLMRFLRYYTLRLFIAYRVFFGIIVIALALFFRHPAG